MPSGHARQVDCTVRPVHPLLAAGPPGCGKSVVLRVLAACLGFELCEWQPPVPTLFHEYQYQRSAGLGYSSKLDAFDEFVLRAKLPALSFRPSAGNSAGANARRGGSDDSSGVDADGAGGAASSQQAPLPASQAAAAAGAAGQAQRGARSLARPKLMVLDDLPHAAGQAERERLAAALGDLARTSRFPLVVCLTETTGRAQQERGLNAASGTYQGLHKVGCGCSAPQAQRQRRTVLVRLPCVVQCPCPADMRPAFLRPAVEMEHSGSCVGGPWLADGRLVDQESLPPPPPCLLLLLRAQDLIAVLEAAQATSISFNPITANNIVKALRAVLEREQLSLPEAALAAIAEQAEGDLHNALNTLQFVCTGQQPAPPPAAATKKGRGTKRKAAGGTVGGKGEGGSAPTATGGDGGEAAHVAFAGRDGMLSLFHALGKLLYNKRDPGAAAGAGAASGELAAAKGPGGSPAAAAIQNSQQQQLRQSQQPSSQPWTANGFWHGKRAAQVEQQAPVAAWCKRAPMQFDPEAVLAGASLDAGGRCLLDCKAPLLFKCWMGGCCLLHAGAGAVLGPFRSSQAVLVQLPSRHIKRVSALS